jgi:hypothetical protein
MRVKSSDGFWVEIGNDRELSEARLQIDIGRDYARAYEKQRGRDGETRLDPVLEFHLRLTRPEK